ncbi:MAG: Rieske (2Fe-2S) protein [Candidatus Thioglobus sp.]|nr:MAG: Rieske (2Fe-2S) protein [Candidatus Thioglobus sp.]
MPLIKVCQLSALSGVGSLGFYITEVTPARNIFIVAKDDQLYAYENRCPHTHAPLEWSPHQFLNTSKDHIQCANHGALFEIASGRCVYGPCLNQSLARVAVEISQGSVYLILE